MAGTDNGIAQRIKDHIDLGDYIRRHGVELQPHGRNDLKGLCPFHEDRDPSLIVTPAKGLFHCPGCGKGGSVIDFEMHRSNLEAAEAIRALAAELPSHTLVPANTKGAEPATVKPPSSLSPQRSAQLLERVVKFYQETFKKEPAGRDYLAGRGLKDEGILDRHRVGYCNGSLRDTLPKKGEILAELRELGILLGDGRERFENCVTVPVYDCRGKLLTLYGRDVRKNEKRHLYLPGRPKGIWNLQAAKTHTSLILTEGVLDALSVLCTGRDDAAALGGTGTLSEESIRQLKEEGVGRLFLLLDADEAGRTGAQRLRSTLSEQFTCEALILPGGRDPNDLLVQKGPEGLAEFLAGAMHPGNAAVSISSRLADGFDVSYAVRRYRVRGLEKGKRKLKATVRVECAGRLHVDTLDFYSARSRRSLCADIARVLQQPSDTIESDITKLMLACESYTPKAADPGAEHHLSPEAKRKARKFGESPRLLDRIRRDLKRLLVGESDTALLLYLACVSRKLSEPLSVLILSSSGAGKSSVMNAVCRFVPEEDLVKLTTLSGKALFHKDPYSLQHKVLAIEESHGMAEASYPLRCLLSEGRLVSETTITDPTTGRLTTCVNTLYGPVAGVVSSTDPKVDPETRSRFIVKGMDEEAEQTLAILRFQREQQGLEGLQQQHRLDAILERHHNFQRLLKKLHIVNPYHRFLDFADSRLNARREQPKYLGLLKSVCLLRQMQKEIKVYNGDGRSVEYIEVDLEDIRITNDLAERVLGRSLDELSAPARSLYHHLEDLVEKRLEQLREKTGDNRLTRSGIRFTRSEIRRHTGWSNYRVLTYLRELLSLEYVLLHTGRNGSLHRYRLASEAPSLDNTIPLFKDAGRIAQEAAESGHLDSPCRTFRDLVDTDNPRNDPQ